MGAFASPFVAPRTVRVDLGDGQWADIKERLSYGDMQHAASLSRADYTLNSQHVVAAYLVDWSLTDATGQPVPIGTDAEKTAALRALSIEAFAVLDRAIGVHAEAADTAKKASKGGRKK